jgi:septal ring factor EnvC (AmiA/AmiB activator)
MILSMSSELLVRGLRTGWLQSGDYNKVQGLLHSAPMKLLSLILLSLVMLSPPLLAQDSNGELTKIKERELEEVREQISDLKRSMDKSAADRDKLTAELQKAEVAISEKRLAIKELERQQQYSAKRKAELEANLVAREAELDQESRELAAQVRAAYMSGNQERIRLLLNQQDPATLGRLMAYYRYLNDYRADNIESVTAHIRELTELHSEISAEEARLETLANARYAELSKLDAAQEQRRELLARLKQRMSTEGQEVQRLAAQEKDLSRLIAELTSILSDYPITSEDAFSKHKGSLTWPVAGTLLHDFGQPRGGSDVKWNGVVLAAPRGREVRAVYHGRVVFADWLAGMGLLVIVDHGEGYMTLYGYNETTLKGAGDWVAPGDVLATVGDSGGRSETSLYFEIRKKTQPINPRQWVTRRPGS